MRMRLACGLLTALIAAAVAVHSADLADESEPSAAAMANGYWGINGQGLRLMTVTGQLELLDRHLSEVNSFGLAFVRANLDWLQLEPSAPAKGRHSYEFDTHDAWVEALARRGLRWYAVGVGTPEWAASPRSRSAGCGIFSPPGRAEDFAALMAAIAARYGHGGSFWEEHPELDYLPVVDYEVWNEANLGGFWCPSPDPAAYAALLAETSRAIRSVDPRARIVLGGLAPFEKTLPAVAGSGARMAVPEFLSGVLAAEPELAELIDVVGVHAYGDPATVLLQLAWYRGVLHRAGLRDLSISLNETGWTTSGEGGFEPVDESTRAGYMTTVADGVARSGCGVSSFAPHTWVTEETDGADQEHWFGLADPGTGKPYPSARAYAEVVEVLSAGGAVSETEQEPACSG